MALDFDKYNKSRAINFFLGGICEKQKRILLPAQVMLM